MISNLSIQVKTQEIYKLAQTNFFPNAFRIIIYKGFPNMVSRFYPTKELF